MHAKAFVWIFLFTRLSAICAEPPVLTSDLVDKSACNGEEITFTCHVVEAAALIWNIGSVSNTIVFRLSVTSTACPLNSSCSDSTGQFTASLTDYSRDDEHPSLGNLTSTLHVNVGPLLPDSPIMITCYDGISFSLPSNLSIAEGPSSPLNVTPNVIYGHGEYSLNVQWETPKFDGGVDIKKYTVVLSNGDDVILEMSTTDTVSDIHHLNYSTNYSFTLIASNCAGNSTIMLTILEAGCAAPSIPDNITIEDVVSTEEGAEIHFHCNNGYSLSNGNTSQCLSSLWSPDPQDQRCNLSIPSGTPSTPPTATPTSSSSVDPTNSSSSTSLSAIIAPVTVVVVIIGALVTALVLGIVLYRHRSNPRKKPRRVIENGQGDHELALLARPGSSASSAAVSSPRSPVNDSYDIVTNPAAPGPYSYVTTPVMTTDQEPTRYCEVTNDEVRGQMIFNDVHSAPENTSLEVDSIQDTGHSTCVDDTSSPPDEIPTQYSVISRENLTTGLVIANDTCSPPDNTRAQNGGIIVNRHYADVSFKQHPQSLPTLDAADRPVQYAELSHPPPIPTLDVEPSPSDGNHDLDKEINIDKVIQQLQELIPHWWALGEAAQIPQSVLEDIANHFQGNDRDSFVEVINQIFIPQQTTWADLARLCEKAGHVHLAKALLDSYKTGVLPIHIEEDEDMMCPPPSEPAPPLPPRDSEDNEDVPPTLPPPLVPDDLPDDMRASLLQQPAPNNDVAPPIPPKTF